MECFFATNRPPTHRPARAWLGSLLAMILLVGPLHRAQAQTFPRTESFQNSTTGGFVLGGTPNSATLTAATGGPDANGSGYLRLTTNNTNQSGYAIDQSSFPAPNGFSISFEFFSYGGNGADGFSMFLVDADKVSAAAFKAGASGGSLGYAQKTSSPVSNGVPFGYIGIGIDEFGNYSNPTEGRVGGPAFTPDAVAIRGGGNGQSTTDYPYLAGSPTLPFKLSVSTVRAQVGTADYRRAYIDVLPVTDANGVKTFRITVRIQNGLAVQTAVNNFLVPAPPANLRIGFSGSTGGQTNYHEVRNLVIRQAPVLFDDLAGTPYNKPVSINVIANDKFPYANYKPGSVDLDPNTGGLPHNSFTVPGKGTFIVDANGLVTFTPSGTFAGVVTIPYTAADVQSQTGPAGTQDQTALPANITIIVNGADIVNSVSGPTAAGPGATVQYTVTTSNLGALAATNVVPTLQLPASLANVVVSGGGSYNATSGLVTFAGTGLAAGGAPVTNTVSFTAPTSGSVVGTANNTATEPDPVPGNNAASITTLINGIANAAGVCAQPGRDGPGSLGLGSAPNTYFPGQSVTTPNGGKSSITLGAALTGAGAGATAIAAGDLVLVMQMQGATINTANTNAYGSGGATSTGTGTGNLTGVADKFTAGLFEYAVATGTVPAGGGTLALDRALINTYDNLDYADASNPTGQRRFQVIRVPQYSNLAVADSVAGAPWNGATGGVLALDVAGRTTFSANAKLTMTGRGFRGGGGVLYTGTPSNTYTGTDFRQLSNTKAKGAGGAKGEGTAGTPFFVNGTALGATAQTTTSTGVEGYLLGSNGRGAPGNAGGGGTDLTPADNSRNTGGGGGANGGQGGLGGHGYSYTSGVDNSQGLGGAAFGASAGRLAMGGGGGAGSRNTNGPSSGSSGGGIILLRTGLVAGPGQIITNGLGGPLTANGGGGGGAGGAVLLLAGNAANLSALTVTARGGRGANANAGATSTTNTTSQAYGPGGGGGGGAVFTNGAVAAGSAAVGGASGTTTTAAIAFGATAGTDATIATNTAASGSGTTACLPNLTVAMNAAPNNVTRRGGATGPVNPTFYTLNVANTGGIATGVGLLSSLNALFKYDNTTPPVVKLTLADGSTSTPIFTVSPNGTSTPQFGGFTIPAGATLVITFKAAIDATAQNGLAYQASTVVSYDNPLRTATSALQVSPGQPYNSGDATLGTAGGSSYSGGAGTVENVTIQAPLPVSLARFTAVAVRLDAQLRWTTASERDNDRFVVERSADGSAFEAVGTVRGQGNSTKAVDYAFADAGAARYAASGQPLYYRLRQVDLDGTSTYSPVRTVAFGVQGPVSLYPNPSPSGQATLDLGGLPAGTYAVQVLDLTGRAVASYVLAGAAQHQLDLRALAVGTYVIRVRGGAISQSLLLTRE